MKRIEIFFHNLDSETQAELLAAAGVKSSDDMNWDVYPVCVVEYEKEEE